jgi:hypothetical protein
LLWFGLLASCQCEIGVKTEICAHSQGPEADQLQLLARSPIIMVHRLVSCVNGLKHVIRNLVITTTKMADSQQSQQLPKLPMVLNVFEPKKSDLEGTTTVRFKIGRAENAELLT